MTTIADPTIITTVRSESNPSKTYEIRKSNRDGTVYCTCPAWKFQKVSAGQPRMCKHLRGFLRQVNGLKLVVAETPKAPKAEQKVLFAPNSVTEEYEELTD